ncbi:MAG: ABC transporter substrate-binding protein [Nitrospira sp.]|nr:ABC transporter substrate-binding protein [Nitrospira sp.]
MQRPRRDTLRLSGIVNAAFISLILGWPLAGNGQAAPEHAPPTAVVRATLDAVFHILDDQQLKGPGHLTQRRHLLENIIAERFDYEEMSKRTLAAHWKPLSQTERQEFVQLFKAFLSDQYAARIEGYAGERVIYLSERTVDGYAEVRTRLVSDKLDIPMDYRLTNRGGTWYAYDVIVDGVSLVMNYRSQFEKIIGESSFQELLRRLKARRVSEEKTKT